MVDISRAGWADKSMNTISKVAGKRLEFRKRWRNEPDIIVLTPDEFDDVQSPSMNRTLGDHLLGMEIELGDKMECKFAPQIEIAK